VVVGEGYRFSYKREGTVQTLKALAREYGRGVYIADDYKNISTSGIRALLDWEEVTSLLGFPFFVMGTVTQGRRLGHVLGFPTLNIYPTEEKFLPRFGVYATRTHINGRTFDGITNVGLRPTVNEGETVPTVETHLFGFNEDAYGREIRVEFLRFVREEKRFDGLEELKAQIREDIRLTRFA
jgi:riboflavin kinase/FMN adenylyltransferase